MAWSWTDPNAEAIYEQKASQASYDISLRSLFIRSVQGQ